LKSCAGGADDPMQAPIFDHDKQDSFLDTEYTIKKCKFAIKIWEVQSNPGRDGIDCLIIRNFPNESLEIMLEMYNDILKARVFRDDSMAASVV
jgi:hypothetical protein